MTRNRFAGLAILAALACLIWWLAREPVSAQQKIQPPVTKWEYIVISPVGLPAGVELNKLGEEGWELAGTVSSVNGGGGDNRIRTDATLIFKRPKR